MNAKWTVLVLIAWCGAPALGDDKADLKEARREIEQLRAQIAAERQDSERRTQIMRGDLERMQKHLNRTQDEMIEQARKFDMDRRKVYADLEEVQRKFMDSQRKFRLREARLTALLQQNGIEVPEPEAKPTPKKQRKLAPYPAVVARVQADFDSLKQAGKLFKLGIGRYPAELSELWQQPQNARRWKGPYIEEFPPLDPWGNEYQYSYRGENDYEFHSYGADGAPGGVGEDADLSSKTIKESRDGQRKKK